MRAWMTAALIAFAAADLGAAAAEAGGPLSVEEAHRRAAADEIVLVDIRTPQEWAATGAPAGAERLDLQSPGFGDGLMALLNAEPQKPVALICATGRRTGYVIDRLRQMGVEGVFDVSEGMMGSAAGAGWIAKGLPIERPEGGEGR